MTKSILELNKCPRILIISVQVIHIITDLKRKAISGCHLIQIINIIFKTILNYFS